MYGSNSEGRFSDRIIRDSLMYMGMDLIKTARLRREEKRLHAEALEELSVSFDDEVKPMVVEIEGTQHRLTGTAELQYEEWRELLRQLYISETGFGSDFSVYTDAVELEAEDSAEMLEPIVIDAADSVEAEGDAEQAPEDAVAGATAGI
jgi:hypothetical protein